MTDPDAGALTPDPTGGAHTKTLEEAKIEAEQEREHNRSLVRMLVTYMAAGFLFIVGAAIVAYFVATNQNNDGKDLFLAILPIAAAVVTYWFATRSNEAMKGDDLVKIINAAKEQK